MNKTRQQAALDPQLVQKHINDAAHGQVRRAVPDVPLAKHINHSPFPSQYFQCVNVHGEVSHVVVLRVTYDMQHTLPDGSLSYSAVQTPLATQDAWSGEVNSSSPLWESDFAPYKPKCDVLIVNAASRPPPNQANARRWPCGAALKWVQEGETKTWSKQLCVTGPRQFGLINLSSPQATHEVVINWCNAYGGQIRRPQADELRPDGSVRKKAGSDQWDTDERNPVGAGLDKAVGQPGPQLEPVSQPYTAGFGQDSYPAVCLTAVGKAWLPRRSLAGTYDDAWLKSQWPLPPTDFADGYWNCAPQDQQVDYLPPGLELLLVNLHAPAGSEHRPEKPDETWQARLPKHQLWLGFVAEFNGDAIWKDLQMQMDTLVVDLSAQKVYTTHRVNVPDPRTPGLRIKEMHTVLTAGTPDQPVPAEEWGPLS